MNVVHSAPVIFGWNNAEEQASGTHLGTVRAHGPAAAEAAGPCQALEPAGAHAGARLVAEPGRGRVLEDGPHLPAAPAGRVAGRTAPSHPAGHRGNERGTGALPMEELRQPDARLHDS